MVMFLHFKVFDLSSVVAQGFIFITVIDFYVEALCEFLLFLLFDIWNLFYLSFGFHLFLLSLSQ